MSNAERVIVIVLVILCIICSLAIGLNEGHQLAASHCEKFGAFYNDGTAYDCEKRQ